MESSLLDRMAVLMSKDDKERKETLGELFETLDPSNLQTNKTRSRTVLDNKAVMDVLLNLSSPTSSADVAFNALRVLILLARDDDNTKRLFQEHPRLVPVAMRKLEFGAQNVTEGMQINALALLYSLAVSVDNAREMVTKNPTLVTLLVVKVEFKLEQVQVKALGMLQNLAFNIDNQREMVTKNPTLVRLLVAKVESNSEQVQINALGALWNLAVNVDNQREMVTNNPTLVRLLVAKMESNSEQVQIKALGALWNLSVNVYNKREMVTNNPTLVRLLVAKVESNSEQVQINALGALQSLAFNIDNAREMVTQNPTLVRLLVAKMESNSEQVQEGALEVLQNLAVNVDNKREMFTKNTKLVPLLVAKVESHSKRLQEGALGVLQGLAFNVANRREMAIQNPTLIPLLVAKVESNSERMQEGALKVLKNLAANIDSKREMVTKNPTLVPLLMAKMAFNSEQVQAEALIVLNNLAINVDNAAEMMATSSAVLLPLLVAKMNGNPRFQATRAIYNLSCSPANRAILRVNSSVVAALTKGRENKDVGTSFFSLLTLINLFGAEEDSKVLKADLAMLQAIFGLIARAMNKDGWNLNNSLLAFRYLCVVEHNRQLLWGEYGSEFLTSVLVALQQAIDDKDLDAAENAMSTLAQFSNDAEPLVWMRSNKPRLDEVIDQLAPFPNALKTAQFLQLTLEPPKVVAAPTPVADSKPTIMISYNWKHQAQARLIHAILESQGYPVWRDEQNMKADIMTAMADAVSKSTVVLVLVSPFYRESANCQMECQFAHNNNRKLIPVLVEPGYVFKADGWLGLLLGSKLYYDVSGSQMEPVILNLLRNEVEGGQVAATVAPPVAVAPKQPVPQNEAEIRQWLSKHKHGEEIVNKLVKEGLVEVEDLERLFKMKPDELKSFLELNGKQALTLEAALKEFF
ncbi:hypothetical protein BASA81_002481 [Batrachochytrium salamandrivorans]|nr:hypothetical protein BASA81_002481 [Batrachochytrium salamandrivorans]